MIKLKNELSNARYSSQVKVKDVLSSIYITALSQVKFQNFLMSTYLLSLYNRIKKQMA